MLLAQEICNYKNALLHLVYPDQCVVCDASLSYSERFICHICFSKIKMLSTPLCKKCSKELPPYIHHSGMCTSCTSASFYFQRCFSVVRYDELTKLIFHEIKFKKRRRLLNIFRKHLYIKLEHIHHIVHNAIVIPVPLDPKRKKEREFNQSNIIAKMISTYYHIPYKQTLLRRIKGNSPQSILTRKERLKNLHGAFRVKKDTTIMNKHILLVDDVFTTGSTVNECSKTLKEAGAGNITVFTLARTV